MPTRHKQIGKRAGHDQAMRVPFEPAIAHLGKTKHPLDDPDRMLDLGPHLRFGPVFRPLDLVHHTAMTISAVHEIPRSRRMLADHLWLPKIVSRMARMPRWAILALRCLTS